MPGGAPEPEERHTHDTGHVLVQQHSDPLDAEMLDALSADLREPLAIIKAAGETLLRHGDRLSREERHEFLSDILEASEWFERVLQRFLPANP